MKKYVGQEKIDIIHSHGYKANIYALLASNMQKKSLVATCYPWTETDYSLKSKIYTFLDKSLLRYFDFIITDSDYVKDEIIQSGVSNSKVKCIYNGIDINMFHNKNGSIEKLLNEFKIPNNSFRIGVVGRLTREKGHEIFINSAKYLYEKFPFLYFFIIGDGPLKYDLQNLIAQNNLKNRCFITGIRKDIPQMLSMLNLFVMPSYSEGFPMAVLEAMAAKKPIIATSVGSVPQAIIHNKTGLLIKPDEKELKEAIEILLHDKNKANYLARNAFNRARDVFSSDTMADRYIKIYHQVLNNKR